MREGFIERYEPEGMLFQRSDKTIETGAFLLEAEPEGTGDGRVLVIFHELKKIIKKFCRKRCSVSQLGASCGQQVPSTVS